MTTAAPTQLRLPPPPGFCRAEHCTNRVSVANKDGICDDCKDMPLTGPGVAAGFVCITCKTAPVKAYHSKCYRCRKGGTMRTLRRHARAGQGVTA